MIEPKRFSAWVGVALAVSLPMRGLSAQVVSRLEAGAVTSATRGLVPANAFSLTPDIRYEGHSLKLAARGSAWLSGNAWQMADADLSGTWSSPVRHHLAAELVANASRAYYDPINQNEQIEARARVHLVFSQQGGLWLESGVARPWRVAVVSSVDVAGAGAWAQLGGATLTGTYTNFAFTRLASSSDSTGTLESCTAQADNSGCLRQSHFSDVQGSVHWERRSSNSTRSRAIALATPVT